MGSLVNSIVVFMLYIHGLFSHNAIICSWLLEQGNHLLSFESFNATSFGYSMELFLISIIRCASLQMDGFRKNSFCVTDTCERISYERVRRCAYCLVFEYEK